MPILVADKTKLIVINQFLPPKLKLLGKKVIYPATWASITVSYSMHCYAKSLQLCPTLCHPIEGSPPGSPVPGILQARTLEWAAISFSNAWKWKVRVKLLSRIWLLETPWTAAYQAPPSMGSSRQEYWSGLPLPSPLSFCPAYFTVHTIFQVHQCCLKWQYFFF